MRILDNFGINVNPMKTTFSAKVSAKKQLTEHIHEIEFTLTNPDRIDFKAGQFINIHVPKDGKVVTRAYSIASGPADQGKLMLCYKLVEGGTATTYLNGLAVGDDITFDGPQGHFVLRDPQTPIHFIVTGTGITPMMSMLESMDAAEKVHLWFGVRSEADIFWKDKLEALKETHSWFDYSLCLSQPTGDWDGITGRVTSQCDTMTADSGAHYYLCGSPKMVMEMRKALIEKQVPMQSIFFEIFT